MPPPFPEPRWSTLTLALLGALSAAVGAWIGIATGVVSQSLAASPVSSGVPDAASAALVRCVAPDGSSIYTDHACAASGARPAPMSTALIARLVTEARIAHDQGTAAVLPLGAVDPNAAAPTTLHRRPADQGCARTPHQLAADLRGSLVLGDVNRLAESYHWVGMHSREGQRTLGRLARLLGHPAIDSQYYAAQVSSLDGDDVHGSDTPSIVEFDVHRYAGCYFVRFPSGNATIA